jgi:Ca2+-transporting ATPase
LLVNVLTDGLPAVALARDPASAETMKRPPDRTTRLFPALDWLALAFVGGLVGLSALAAFLLGADGDAAQTRTFATLALAELILVFSMRSRLEHAWHEPRNPYLFAAVASSVAIVALALFVPSFHGPLEVVRLSLGDLCLVAGLASVPAVGVEALKVAVRRGLLPGAAS